METITKKQRKDSITSLAKLSKSGMDIVDQIRSGELDPDKAKEVNKAVRNTINASNTIITEHQTIQREKIAYHYANLEYKKDYVALQREKLATRK